LLATRVIKNLTADKRRGRERRERRGKKRGQNLVLVRNKKKILGFPDSAPLR